MPFYIGRQSGTTTYWDGYLDEVAVFDRALTSVQAVEIYTYGLTGGN